MVGTSLGFDTVLDLCANERRRIVLAALAAEDRTRSITDLTRTIVREQRHADVDDVPDETVEQIRSSLHHSHLPKLESAGLVEYDTETNHLERTDDFEDLQPHLSAILGADPMLGSVPARVSHS